MLLERIWRGRVFVLVLICLFVTTPSFGQEASQGRASDAAQSSGPTLAAVTYEYKLGAGDHIRVNVFGEPDLGGEFSVNGAGIVSLPLIGEVKAQGLTITELQVEIAAAYQKGYLKDPRVNIDVLNFRPFYILGEVNKPGEYPFSNGMTAVKAVALAQGFTYRANQKIVFIKHLNGSAEEKVPLTSTLAIGPGDTVRVAERYF